ADFIIVDAIISSVRLDSSQIEKIVAENFRTINLSSLNDLLLPFKNLYKTPTTLGRDRVANVAAAVNLFPQKNILIIDAGTCLKFDFVDSKRKYHGGSISPGLLMRFKSLNHFTGNLPFVQYKKSKKIVGQTT